MPDIRCQAGDGHRLASQELWLAGKSILEISEAMKPISLIYVHRLLSTKFKKEYEAGRKERKAAKAKAVAK